MVFVLAVAYRDSAAATLDNYGERSIGYGRNESDNAERMSIERSEDDVESPRRCRAS